MNKQDRFEPWIKARRNPNEEEEKRMFKIALEIGLTVVMKNHTYEFARSIRKQSEGGPIGMDLTGTVAKIFMKWWDKEMLRRMNDVGIEVKMYERYVDDINKCVRQTPIGARYVDERLVYSEETKLADEQISGN